jgi:hypothetical protein
MPLYNQSLFRYENFNSRTWPQPKMVKYLRYVSDNTLKEIHPSILYLPDNMWPITPKKQQISLK